MMPSFEEEWQAFAALIFQGCTPTETQRLEMRKAFFAGCWSVLQTVKELADRRTEEGCEWLEARDAEGKAFVREIIAQHATRN